MPGLNFRASGGLAAIIARAQDAEGGNQSAAIRALLLLGADRLGYDLSAVQHEIVMLMMEPIDQAVIEELRVLIGGVPHTLPKRPARERASDAGTAPRRRAQPGAPANGAAPEPRATAQPPVAAYHAANPAAIAGAPPANLAATSGLYDVGEDI
jgi:hypothetical protein